MASRPHKITIGDSRPFNCWMVSIRTVDLPRTPSSSQEAGVRPSMGFGRRCNDKAMCESFFATLECELLDRGKFQTKAEAKMAIFEFIEGWYNLSRRHSALGYKSPINHRFDVIESPTGNVSNNKRLNGG